MTKIATPGFGFEPKKDYTKPTTQLVDLQQQCPILAGSTNGVNDTLQGDEVEEGW